MYNGYFPHRGSVLQGLRILVVEDEALVAILLEDSLRDAGAKVIGPAGTVTEAQEFLDHAIRDGGLDAAVLDVNLGGTTVLPVADRLAALGVPFLVATGYGPDFKLDGHPAVRVLAKPFDPQTLIGALQHWPLTG